MKLGFLRGKDGNLSNSRLAANFMILNAIAMAWVFIFTGFANPELIPKLFQIATAIGVLYGTIAGSAMLFLFGQKRTEEKSTIIPEPEKEAL